MECINILLQKTNQTPLQLSAIEYVHNAHKPIHIQSKKKIDNFVIAFVDLLRSARDYACVYRQPMTHRQLVVCAIAIDKNLCKTFFA